jgi:nuclear pore complex protein Nup107
VHGHLNSARSLSCRVSWLNIIRQRVDDSDEKFDPLKGENSDFWIEQLRVTPQLGLSYSEVVSDAKTLKALESLLKVLDTLETISTLISMHQR